MQNRKLKENASCGGGGGGGGAHANYIRVDNQNNNKQVLEKSKTLLLTSFPRQMNSFSSSGNNNKPNQQPLHYNQHQNHQRLSQTPYYAALVNTNVNSASTMSTSLTHLNTPSSSHGSEIIVVSASNTTSDNESLLRPHHNNTTATTTSDVVGHNCKRLSSLSENHNREPFNGSNNLKLNGSTFSNVMSIVNSRKSVNNNSALASVSKYSTIRQYGGTAALTPDDETSCLFLPNNDYSPPLTENSTPSSSSSSSSSSGPGNSNRNSGSRTHFLRSSAV
jgi:hypothetical protein